MKITYILQKRDCDGKENQQQENNPRLENLWLIALPEGSEHQDLPDFLSKWILLLLGEENFRAQHCGVSRTVFRQTMADSDNTTKYV